MEWQLALLIILGSLLFLMATGMPVAFSFMLVNVIGVFLLWGGQVGLEQFIFSLAESLSTFTLLALPLFVLMGEVIFRAGLFPNMMDALDKWLGRIPGRLSLMAVGGGTLFATLSGASMAGTAMLGATLVPEMERRGYKKPMTLGPILGAGGLAIMIPPSGLAVLAGAIGEISVGRILIGIIIPGLLMAILYSTYIIGRSILQPHLAPPYEVPPTPMSEKLIATVKYILPLGFVIFMVIGVMFLGIATPSEAAATGAFSCFILAAAYGKLNWEVVKKAFRGTLLITGMLFLIIAGAKAFGHLLAFSGATTGLIEFAGGLPVDPIVIMIAMQVIVLIMGMFMEVGSIIMITLPLFMPIVYTLGFDPVWFAIIILLNIEMGTTSPPFGISLFVMKGVAPPDTTMGDVYRASLPFLGCDLIAMGLIIVFPALALWLPSLMMS